MSRGKSAWLPGAALALLTVLAAVALLAPRLLSRPRAPRVVVLAEDPGRPRQAMLTDVALPLERRLASLPGVRTVESRSGGSTCQSVKPYRSVPSWGAVAIGCPASW